MKWKTARGSLGTAGPAAEEQIQGLTRRLPLRALGDGLAHRQRWVLGPSSPQLTPEQPAPTMPDLSQHWVTLRGPLCMAGRRGGRGGGAGRDPTVRFKHVATSATLPGSTEPQTSGTCSLLHSSHLKTLSRDLTRVSGTPRRRGWARLVGQAGLRRRSLPPCPGSSGPPGASSAPLLEGERMDGRGAGKGNRWAWRPRAGACRRGRRMEKLELLQSCKLKHSSHSRLLCCSDAPRRDKNVSDF